MDPHDIHVQDIHVARRGYVELKKINDGHDGNLCVLKQVIFCINGSLC